jgi:hypothetical protein
MFDKIDGFLGRMLFMALGILPALMAPFAAFVAVKSLLHWQGWQSFVSFALFGSGAVAAGWAAAYCFSRKRTLGDVISAAESDPSDTGAKRKNTN